MASFEQCVDFVDKRSWCFDWNRSNINQWSLLQTQPNHTQ